MYNQSKESILITSDEHIEIIRRKALDSFISIFEKALAQKVLIDFEKIYDQILININLYEYKNDLSIKLESYLKTIFHDIYNHNSIKNHLENTKTFEILIHSPNCIQLDQGGALIQSSSIFHSQKLYQLSLESMVLKEIKEWNFKNPFISFNITLFNHSFRATLIHHSITPNGISKVFLRRINPEILPLSKFNIDEEVEFFLKDLVSKKKNIIIAGSTGSGKTTFTKSLMSLIPNDEHLVVLEDTFELSSCNPSQSNLLAEGKKEGKSLKDFCSYAMRMRPDRMIIGEMRSHEVVPFILAMNTGHKGLMSTIHANNAIDALHRIALLFSIYSDSVDLSYELVMKLVAQNIDYIVFMKNKSVVEIIKVLGSEKSNPFVENIYKV